MEGIIRYIMIGIVLIAVIACSSDIVKKEDTLRRVKYKIVEAEASVKVENCYGVIKEQEQMKLSFRKPGPVLRLFKKEGEYVKKGEVLASMDDRDYKLKFQATKYKYGQLSSEVGRLKALYRSHNLADNDYEKAISGLQQLKVMLENDKNALKDMTLRAPFDGVVQKVIVHEGELVSAGMTVYSLVRSNALRVRVSVPYSIVLKSAQLKSAIATSSYYKGHSFPLSFIGSTIKPESNNLYAMWFSIKSTNKVPLVSGMNLQIALKFDVPADTYIRIPLCSCIHENSHSYVFCYRDGKVLKRTIELLDLYRDGYASVYGLSGGDTLITAGVHSLEDQMNVLLIQEDK
ncbi:efflux RND transporter periplasmic adaptor subunit [Halosquirtibacter laminarini]|uniref:Efflux RND transporter periplasmic adaptor subunit n=1 Tax=Halosquirtibacter laminarini TaxID=3374600 RepID=A0AC61NNJ4_9BACT|nr:efflux RND transporter periplasmic adaptor subunit [Prolixibacteraceae bacterium]